MINYNQYGKHWRTWTWIVEWGVQSYSNIQQVFILKSITNLLPAEIHGDENLCTEPGPHGTWNHAAAFQQSDPTAVKIVYIANFIVKKKYAESTKNVFVSVNICPHLHNKDSDMVQTYTLNPTLITPEIMRQLSNSELN